MVGGTVSLFVLASLVGLANSHPLSWAMPFAGATDYEKTYSKEACEGVYGKLQRGA